MPDEDQMAAKGWLKAGKTYTFHEYGSIDNDHWLNALLLDVTDDDIEVGIVNPKGSQTVSTWSGYIELFVSAGVNVTHVGTQDVRPTDAVFVSEDGALYTTVETLPACHTRQISSYINGNDQFMEGEEDEDCDRLNKAHAEVLAVHPWQLLTIMLKQHNGLQPNTRLASATFTVVFDEHGAFKEVVAA